MVSYLGFKQTTKKLLTVTNFTKILSVLFIKTIVRPIPVWNFENSNCNYIMLFQAKLKDPAVSFVPYGESKLANICHMMELAELKPNIGCFSLHPGLVKTELGKVAIFLPVQPKFLILHSVIIPKICPKFFIYSHSAYFLQIWHFHSFDHFAAFSRIASNSRSTDKKKTFPVRFIFHL